MQLELWIMCRLVAAALMGGVVGYERATSGKEAGLRTHMLVSIGAALFASFNDLALYDVHAQAVGLPERAQIQIQPLATVQAVATGVGFLGAGTIFLGGRKKVHGLTTAASIWAISAVGLAVGFDRYLLAVGATALLLVVLRVLVVLEPSVAKKRARDSPADNAAHAQTSDSRQV